MSDPIMIVANSDGWEPERTKVNSVLSKMKSLGLRTDWAYCLALKTHALMFLCHPDHEVVESEVIYFHGKFLTEDEYYLEPLTKRERELAVKP